MKAVSRPTITGWTWEDLLHFVSCPNSADLKENIIHMGIL